MTSAHPSISLASAPQNLTLSQESSEGVLGSIRIPLGEIDTVCELLRQAKHAIGQPVTAPEPEAEMPIPGPASLPESVIAAMRAEMLKESTPEPEEAATLEDTMD